jgi:hypothetical protein
MAAFPHTTQEAPMVRPSLGALVVASQAPPALRSYIQIVNVKPESVNDWLAMQQKETIPAIRKAGTQTRQTWTTQVFGESFEYFFVTPLTAFSDFDNQNPIVRALGADAARVYNDKLRKMIVSQRGLAITVFPESINPAASYEPKFMILNFNYAEPEHAAAYEAYLRNDAIPAIKKAKPLGYVVSRTLHGGDANEFVTARYMDKMAELDGPNLMTKALGADGAAKMGAKSAGMLARTERRVYRFVPELSFAAAAGKPSQ